MRPLVLRATAYAKRALRVSGAVTVIAIVLGLVLAARARAAMADAALSLGGELSKIGVAMGPANRVRLNGELVNVASAMVDDAPAAVLDRFEGECRAHSGGIAEEMLALAATSKLPSAAGAGLPGIGVLRKEGEARGAVACLARDGSEGSAGFLRGLQAMLSSSGDLASLGKLRYVVAERSPGATRTHVVAAWTDGSFHLGALFPKAERGDAPGSDPAGAPRPDGSRRLLTASLEGVPYGIRVYDAPGAPTDVLASYDRAMPEQGWRAIAGVAGGLDAKGHPGRAFTRDGVDLMVFADASRKGAARTVVSVIELPPPSLDRP
jgi:hypothetical protein